MMNFYRVSIKCKYQEDGLNNWRCVSRVVAATADQAVEATKKVFKYKVENFLGRSLDAQLLFDEATINSVVLSSLEDALVVDLEWNLK